MVGSFAFALALMMRTAGLLAEVERGLAQAFAARGFGEFWEARQPWWDLLLVAVLVYALVWLLFEIPGTGRRVMVLLSATTLVLALSPVLALWGIFWSPLNAMLGVVWGGFCAIMWARQHTMACELPEEEEPEQPQEGKIIPMNGETEEVAGEAEPETVTGSGDAPGKKRGRSRRKARRTRKK